MIARRQRRPLVERLRPMRWSIETFTEILQEIGPSAITDECAVEVSAIRQTAKKLDRECARLVGRRKP